MVTCDRIGATRSARAEALITCAAPHPVQSGSPDTQPALHGIAAASQTKNNAPMAANIAQARIAAAAGSLPQPHQTCTHLRWVHWGGFEPLWVENGAVWEALAVDLRVYCDQKWSNSRKTKFVLGPPGCVSFELRHICDVFQRYPHPECRQCAQCPLREQTGPA